MAEESKIYWLGKTEAAKNAIQLITVIFGLFFFIVTPRCYPDETDILFGLLPATLFVMMVLFIFLHLFYLGIKKMEPNSTQYNTMEWILSIIGLTTIVYFICTLLFLCIGFI